jgi:hypothetical protein
MLKITPSAHRWVILARFPKITVCVHPEEGALTTRALPLVADREMVP